jgi:hypothetical protein
MWTRPRVAVALVLAAACIGAHAKDGKVWHKKPWSRHRSKNSSKDSLWRHAEDSAHAFEKVVRYALHSARMQ